MYPNIHHHTVYNSWAWKQPRYPSTDEWVRKLWYIYIIENSVQFSSVAPSYPTLCDPVNHSTPGLPIHHQLPESTQTHVYRVSDAILPSHLLSSSSPPTLNLSQHQGLFKWVSSLHQVAKVLEFQLQHQSFQWTPRTDLLWDALIWSPCSPRGLSRVFSNTMVQKHQFFNAQFSL